MAETLFAKRSLLSLRPVDAFGEEIITNVSFDEVVKLELTRPRNLKHHRQFFGLLNAVYPHQTLYPTRRSFRAAMACALGFGETVKLGNGRTVLVPGSISFANMDEAEFCQFYDRAVELIVMRILPNIDRADVEREVADIMAGRNGVPDYAMEGAR